MATIIYIIRHGATLANLARPATLLGRKMNPSLAPTGVKQAQATRDLMAVMPLDAVYTSPMLRAKETTAIVCEPHTLKPTVVDGLIECDLGRWEGSNWEAIRYTEPDNHAKFMKNPADFGYPDGENFEQVTERAEAALEEIIEEHEGEAVLVVSHNIVVRTYLASVLGMGPSKARNIILDNCGISVVKVEGNKPKVTMMNATFHLGGVEKAD